VPRKESKIERDACRRALDEQGVPNIKMIHPGGETGWPDRCFFIPGGKPFLLEFKEVGYKPDKKQAYIHDMLEGLGYDVAWTDNTEDALAAIRARVASARLSKARR
jgi:hypothetical protein